MPTRRLYVVAYDIRDPARLRRVLQVVKSWSAGGQKSVHECWLEEGEAERLIEELEAQVHPEVDSLVVFRPEDPKKTRTLGIAVPPEDRDWFYFA